MEDGVILSENKHLKNLGEAAVQQARDTLAELKKGTVIIPQGRVRHGKLRDKRRDPDTGEMVVFNNYTLQQDIFCRLKAEGFNDTQAYKRAYPNSNTPHVDGHKLNKLPKIKARIGQLLKERAQAAQLVSPEESLSRWNFLYHTCMENGDIKGMMEAQKQIDKINGADQAIVKQQIEMKTLFRGEEDEWKDTAKSLMEIVSPTLRREGNSITVTKNKDGTHALEDIELTIGMTEVEDTKTKISKTKATKKEDNPKEQDSSLLDLFDSLPE